MTFECRPVKATSLMAKQWGLKSGSKGGTHKVRAHPEWLVPSYSKKHGPHCQKQGTEVMLVAVRPGLVGPPGFHTTAREPKRAHFRVPVFTKTTKIQREDTQRDTERAKLWREREEKARNFGPPTLSGPHPFGAPNPSGPPTHRGPQPIGAPPFLAPPFWAPPFWAPPFWAPPFGTLLGPTLRDPSGPHFF